MWWIWHWRNAIVFQQALESVWLIEKLRSLVYYLQCNKDAWLKGSNTICKHGQTVISIFWQPLAGDQVKLNMMVRVKGILGIAMVVAV